MPYDTYRLYQIERAKSPVEVQRADEQAARLISAVSSRLRGLTRPVRAIRRPYPRPLRSAYPAQYGGAAGPATGFQGRTRRVAAGGPSTSRAYPGRRASRMSQWMLHLMPSASRRLLCGSGTVLAKPGHDRFSASVGSGGDIEGGVP